MDNFDLTGKTASVTGNNPATEPVIGTDPQGTVDDAEPRVQAGVWNSMRIAQQDVFGPIEAVIPFADEIDCQLDAWGVDEFLGATSIEWSVR